MRETAAVIYQVFGLLTAVLGAWFGVISLCFLLKERTFPKTDQKLRFAVLIAARNEESCIAGIVESLRQQNYPSELVDIYVIPNNCTDDTAGAAAAAGAQIIHVPAAVRSKGAALHEAFAWLLEEENHDAYCVFDADNEADSGFLAEMNRALAFCRAAKSRILAKNAHESWVCACYDTYFCNANLFLNGARQKLGLSARLVGTGFAVRRDLMEELAGWNTETLTEDAEFYASLAARGERITFVPGAVTYDEEPLTFRESLTQRRRWMSGVMTVGRLKAVDLLRGVFGKRNGVFALDALVQFAFTWLQAGIIPVFLLWACAEPQAALANLPGAAVSFYAGAFFTGGAALIFERRLTGYTFRALFLYPLFTFSFLLLQTASLFRPNRAWKPIRHTGVRMYPSSTPKIQFEIK